MTKRDHKIKQLEEKMRILFQIISDRKVSKEKSIELEIEYCFLQDKLETIKKLKE